MAHTVRASVEEYMKVCMEKLLDGFRVEVGNQFITLSPAITAIGARGRIGCVVNTEFTHEFNRLRQVAEDRQAGQPLGG